jgi:hypothetical protein
VKREAQKLGAERDGQRDFDFNIGTWKTHVSRLLHPLAGSATWSEYQGTSVVRKVWNGSASLLELEVDGPAGHIEGVGLRLYSPQSHQWSLNWANSRDGTLAQPMIGAFTNGRGEFYAQESSHGRTIFARNSFSDITPDSSRFEQAFSADGGKTWETNWVMTFTRARDESGNLRPLQGFAQQNSRPSKTGRQHTPAQRDGQHDFDFEIGTWKTHLKRLLHPLTDSTTWVEYEGTTVVQKVWNGRANLVELEIDGPAGHLEGLSLRLYDPQARQWSLNFANSSGGTLAQPSIGEFRNGRGEFFDQETLNGRAIFARFVISDITSNSCHFEQAFSDDGGKTWEVNWITTDTRMKNEPGQRR